MLDIKLLRQNPDTIKKALQKRGVRSSVIDKILELDRLRLSTLKSLEQTAAEQNRLSKAIAKEKDITKKSAMLAEAQELSKRKDEANHILKEIEPEYYKLLNQLPNLPQEDVPVGQDEKSNVVIREEGQKPKFDFKPKDYLEIAEKLDIIDVKRAAKVSGTRFGYIKREGTLLEFALVQFALDELTKQGFIPVVPPVLIKPEMLEKMGYIQLNDSTSKLNEEVYFMRDDNLVLVGTSEQSVGPMHADEIFKDQDLPRRYVAFSSCFRREAGSYGKDTKGILRVHQFDKVEMFSFSRPEKSRQEHQFLLTMAESLLQKLQIPYRIVQLCTSDLSKPSAATFDIECWLPGQNQYRETNSISNTTDFQARRLNIRYRSKNGKLQFVHMLNGTAFAIGRILIAIIENYQNKDGSINVPKVLQKYINLNKIKR